MNDEKYEKALEAARKELNVDRKELPVLERVFSNIFPEPAESEDERIRKFLVKHVSEWIGCIEHDLKISSKDVESEEELAMFKAGLAYLEKQKEQKPELYDMGRWDEESYNNGIHHVLQNPEVYGLTKQKPIHTAKEMWKEMRLEVYAQASGNRHEPNHSDDSTKMFSLCDIDEIFEKIGNSTVGLQPAEWSDSVAKDMFIKALERAVEQTKKGYELTDCDRHSWWEDFKAYSEIKPAEWSEEDEKFFKTALWHISYSVSNGKTTDDHCETTDWLKGIKERIKSLRPVKQEWSEEDERKFQCIRNILLTDGDKKVGSWRYSEVLEWYEKKGIGRYTNSQPRWKPSKKQPEWT